MGIPELSILPYQIIFAVINILDSVLVLVIVDFWDCLTMSC